MRTLLLCCVLAVPAATQAPAASTGSDEDKAVLLELLSRLIPAAEAELTREGSDPTDVRALARRLGTPAAAIAFVREQIAFEPYDGVLRGAAGALAARAANSWDKALLLQEVLAAMGQASQLVQVVLTDEQATRLVDAFLNAKPAADPPGDEAAALAGLARVTGFSADRLQRLWSPQRQAALGALEEVQRLASAHAGALRRALQLVPDGTAMRRVLVASCQRHAQLRLDAGELGRQIETTPLAAAGAPPEEGAMVHALPQHTLLFRLLYARSDGETPILEAAVPVADCLRLPLAFLIEPAEDWGNAVALAQLSDTEQQSKLRRIKLWQAALSVGGARHNSRVFDLKGGLHDVSGDGRIRAAGDLGASAQRGFGGLGGEEPPAQSAFAALTLVVTLRDAAGNERPFVRRLLDAAGVAAGKLPALRWEILALGGPVGGEPVARAVLSAGLPLWRALRLGLGGSEDVAELLRGIESASRTPVPATLLRLQAAREAAVDALAGRQGLRPLVRSAQVFVLEQRVDACQGGTACASIAFDWLANDICFLPPAGGDAGPAFAAALELGCFDTALEATSLERGAPAAHLLTAGHAMAAAVAAQAPLAQKPDAGGRKVVAVGGSGTWYEIDATFGCAVGRVPGGRGGAAALLPPQALVEFAESQRAAFWAIMCVAPNVVGAATGKRSSTKTAVALIACIAGFGVRFGGYVASAAFKAKGVSLLLGFTGDFISSVAALAGLFI